jgi:hypothetical protein
VKPPGFDLVPAWRVDTVEPTGGRIDVHVAGPLPAPATDPLRTQLDRAGLENVKVRVVLVPEYTVDLAPP